MATESDDRKSLPFEPKKNPKASQSAANKKLKSNYKPQKAPVSPKPPFTKEEMAVPKVVSDRMARRMALLCGVPTALGMATFVVSYLIVNHGWLKLPTVAVVLVSMGFFGLGVLGLSYGVLSASWDEEVSGTKLGWQEFKTNWGRMTSAWRSNKQKNV